MTQIKICGIRTSHDADVVNQTQPDFAGFVFAAGNHQIKLDQAKRLRAEIDAQIPTVGVFVDAPLAEMVMAVDSGAINFVQLHGHESEGLVKQLQDHRIPVINMVGAQVRPTIAEYVMVDAGKGSGQQLDWSAIRPTTQSLVLAGGLNPTNLEQAIQTVHPDMIDLSSGVETDGEKDMVKVREVVALAHKRS